MFLGLPDLDPLVRGMDPDPALDLDPDPSIQGFLGGFFGVFLGFFAQMRGFLGFFSISRTLLGASRL
jgi:hypothetical protein